MIFTTSYTLNKYGTFIIGGVGVTNRRIKNRRASLSNLAPISKTFNINNSDTWYVSYPENLSLNFTLTLSNGEFTVGGDHTLQNDQGIAGDASNVYFIWSSPNAEIKQSIVSINDTTNTITWKLSGEMNDRNIIKWTRR